MALAEHVYAFTTCFPAVERFGLSSQLRRAAVSVCANIAEGNGRAYRREYVHHLSIARGSLRETATLIELARRLDYMRPADLAKAEDTGEQIGPMLTRLIKSLQTPGRR